ncbi:MAG: ABC transporter permease [Peptostreptococcaceae bacterium]|jgi:ABC-type antimicrobial peptide transport system permease subunit|nr:ABC transporter permease [Peptostreptococcaceae bacterium]
MNSNDLFKMALANLFRRKTRTILTILGVIIGTASIVTMMSLGIATEYNFKKDLENWGDLTTVEVEKSWNENPNAKLKYLDDRTVSVFRKLKHVEGVMPIKTERMNIIMGDYKASINVIGVNPNDLEAFKFKAEEGRLLSESDRDAIIVGTNIKRRFRKMNTKRYERLDEEKVKLLNKDILITSDRRYGDKDRDKDDKELTPREVKCVGLLEAAKDYRGNSAYMNLFALEKILKEDKKERKKNGDDDDDKYSRYSRTEGKQDKYETINVKVDDMENVLEVQETIEKLGLSAYSEMDYIKRMKEQAESMQKLLGGIGAVSLLVAAIGITNTMVMSIYERTTEIGVMKVIGARITDIKKLFLIESAMIGFLGGLLGLFLSYLVSYLLNGAGNINLGDFSMQSYGDKISMITWQLASGGVLFSTLIGIISGYSPARRAMKLSALEAIKNS